MAFLGTFDIGDQPTFQYEFRNISNVLTNPATVKVTTKNPTGTETVYTFPVAQLANPSTGVYQFTIPQLTASQVGDWTIRANFTSSNSQSIEDTFTVRPSAFTTPLP
jgi:uncharacterized protein YfaS (alpha-2-macroglobulin family)